MDFENYFYRQARNALDQTDLLQCFGSTTLTTLQATIVLAQYETQHAMFDRAWLTMCRVSWLIDAARLEDQESGANSMTTHDPGTISAVWEARRVISFLCLGGRATGLPGWYQV
jgi:hypothetical protein